MNTALRITVISLVTLCLVALLFVPLQVKNITVVPLATSATISLVQTISVEKPQAITEEPFEEVQQAPIEPAPHKAPAPLQEVFETPQTVPVLEEDTNPVVATEAASAVAEEALPSLIDGYYQAEVVTLAPDFDRNVLGSRIKYPPLAKRQGKEGIVILRLFISDTGLVDRIIVEEDPGYGLADAAVAAFTNLQGKPAMLEGKAVPVTLKYPVRFTLR